MPNDGIPQIQDELADVPQNDGQERIDALAELLTKRLKGRGEVEPDVALIIQEIIGTARRAIKNRASTDAAVRNVDTLTESLEPPAEELQRALTDLAAQHSKTDDVLQRESIRRDTGMGAVDFSVIEERVMQPANVQIRIGICNSFRANGRMTPVAKDHSGRICLLEGCEASSAARGNHVFNKEAAKYIGKLDHPNVLDALDKLSLSLPSLHLMRRHLIAFSDCSIYSSDWAAPRDGMTREELENLGFAARFYRGDGEARGDECGARVYFPVRRFRGALWV